MKKILSGIQPSGLLHLGNYFGAIRQHIALQDQGDAMYFIADYHALTTIRKPGLLRNNTRRVAMTYLALGLDPDRSTLFRQSDVPEVTELAWILSNVVGVGVLQRAHSYKDKVAQGIQPHMGLFSYPILMAADILMYDTEVVPVGRDQIQHVEMARDIARSFNAVYGPVFVEPQAQVVEEVAVVPGLDGRKMSKSYGNTIPLFCESNTLKKIVSRIVTDSTDFRSEPMKPSECNVFALLKLFLDADELVMLSLDYLENREFGYGHAKKLLRDKITEHFADAQARMTALATDENKSVDDILEQGARYARRIALKKIIAVRKAVGIGG